MSEQSARLIYQNNYKIAHVLEACSGNLGLDVDPYTLRPYNQYKLANTAWRLAPGAEIKSPIEYLMEHSKERKYCFWRRP